MKAGTSYPLAYRAAFRSEALDRLASLRVPALLAANDGDILAEHLRRAKEVRGDLPTVVLRDGPEQAERAADAYAAFLEAPRKAVSPLG